MARGKKYQPEQVVNLLRQIEVAVTLLGIAYLNNENAEEAMSTFARAVRLDPQHARSHMFLGHALVKGKRFSLSNSVFHTLKPEKHFPLLMLSVLIPWSTS